VGPPASIVRPAHVVHVNVTGSVNVFEAALQNNVRRLIDISSEEVYGHFQADEIDEDHPQEPNSPYGVTKLAVEKLGLQYVDHFGLDYVAGRVCWAYGHRYPRVRPPQSWIKDALSGRRTTMERGGDHLLDLTYVDDVAAGFQLLCEADTLEHRAYHITSGRAVTLRDVAKELSQLLGGWEYEIGPGSLEMGPGFIAARKGALKNDRARIELGFVPRFDLSQGLAANIERLQAANEQR
jgi:nucleoside-diphosphate-sugar epimerase